MKHKLTKEILERRKDPLDILFFKEILTPNGDEQSLLFALDNLGRLPPNFDGKLFLPLLKSSSKDIRLLAIKNIGKLKNANNLDTLVDLAKNEDNTIIRREIVSAIGRMRTLRATPILIDFLNDPDAKIVMQAIRALLYFKSRQDVLDALSSLVNHPHELVQSVIGKELRETREKTPKDTTHRQSPDFLKNVLVNGDVREILGYIQDGSVHLTFTSPPYYNARDYTLYRSYDEYLEFLVSVFKEVHRITKEGRFFVLNTSPVIVPRMSRKHSSSRYLIPFDIHPLLTKIGWEFIEDIVWLKPDPSAKNRNGGFFQHRKPLAYKANSISEYVIVYRKKTDKLIDWNMDQYPKEIVEQGKVRGNYEKTNAWKIAPSNDKVHPAIFPRELASRIIQLYSFPGDLVFDPFAGVGTVGQVAASLERYFFLTEKEPAYISRAELLFGNKTLFDARQPVQIYTSEQFKCLMQSGGK